MARCRPPLRTILTLTLLGAAIVLVCKKLLTHDSQLSQQRSRSNGLSTFSNSGLANPGEVRRREVELDPREGPVEIKRKEVELGSESWTTLYKETAPPATPTKTQVPRTSSREEQVAALNTLQKLLAFRPVSYTCKNIVVLRNRVEGTWKYCNDENYVVQKPCLVYSFGVSYDFTFEDRMAELGCEVLSFDPSMNVGDHRRSPQVMFYAIGLGHEDTDTFDPHLDIYVKKKTTWKMRTLESLLKQHNHTERVIDVLKMDIESYEWNVTRNMLDSGAVKNVRQLLLEWHVFNTYPAREEFPRMAATVQDLDMAGFQDFFKNAHTRLMGWNKLQFQSDMGYVNSNTKRSHS